MQRSLFRVIAAQCKSIKPIAFSTNLREPVVLSIQQDQTIYYKQGMGTVTFMADKTIALKRPGSCQNQEYKLCNQDKSFYKCAYAMPQSLARNGGILALISTGAMDILREQEHPMYLNLKKYRERYLSENADKR